MRFGIAAETKAWRHPGESCDFARKKGSLSDQRQSAEWHQALNHLLGQPNPPATGLRVLSERTLEQQTNSIF
jgi:hypothetical protein